MFPLLVHCSMCAGSGGPLHTVRGPRTTHGSLTSSAMWEIELRLSTLVAKCLYVLSHFISAHNAFLKVRKHDCSHSQLSSTLDA